MKGFYLIIFQSIILIIVVALFLIFFPEIFSGKIFYEVYLIAGLCIYFIFLMILSPLSIVEIRKGLIGLGHSLINGWNRFKQISKNLQVKIGFIFILFILGCVFFANALAQYPPDYRLPVEFDKQNRSFTVFDNLHPTWKHWFGTSPGGEDVFSQVMYGLRNTIKLAGVASIFSLVLGTVLGLFAGYYRKIISKGIDYLVNMILVLPILFLILLLGITIKIQFFSIVVIISIYGMAKTAKLVKGEVLVLKEKEFVMAAKAIGQPEMGILFKHLVPVLYPMLLTQFLTLIGSNIAIESSLSFLRFHHIMSLGALIHDSFFMSLVKGNWWYFAFPALFLAISIIGFSFLGDGLKQAIYQPVKEEEC